MAARLEARSNDIHAVEHRRLERDANELAHGADDGLGVRDEVLEPHQPVARPEPSLVVAVEARRTTPGDRGPHELERAKEGIDHPAGNPRQARLGSPPPLPQPSQLGEVDAARVTERVNEPSVGEPRVEHRHVVEVGRGLLPDDALTGWETAATLGIQAQQRAEDGAGGQVARGGGR